MAGNAHRSLVYIAVAAESCARPQSTAHGVSFTYYMNFEHFAVDEYLPMWKERHFLGHPTNLEPAAAVVYLVPGIFSPRLQTSTSSRRRPVLLVHGSRAALCTCAAECECEYQYNSPHNRVARHSYVSLLCTSGEPTALHTYAMYCCKKVYTCWWSLYVIKVVFVRFVLDVEGNNVIMHGPPGYTRYE